MSMHIVSLFTNYPCLMYVEASGSKLRHATIREMETEKVWNIGPLAWYKTPNLSRTSKKRRQGQGLALIVHTLFFSRNA